MEEARSLLNQYPRYLHLAASKTGPSGEIVEIAIADSNGSALLDEFVRPRGAIRPQLSEIHGITNERVHAAPPWPEVWPKVRPVLLGQTVLCYDPAYCLGLLRQSHQVYHLRLDFDPIQLTGVRSLVAHYHQEVDPRRGVSHDFGLEQAAQALGLSSEAVYFRRSLDDAALLRLILLRLANPAGRLYTE